MRITETDYERLKKAVEEMLVWKREATRLLQLALGFCPIGGNVSEKIEKFLNK